MIWAAVDVMDGQCVQLEQGDPDTARYARDPLEAARHWVEQGADGLHIVDLDAAMDRGGNVELVREALQMLTRPVQVGGGVRHASAIEEWLSVGADRVVVGTRAIRDGAWLAAMAERFPGRLVVALDARDGVVMTDGWTTSSGERALELAQRVDGLGLAALLYTNVGVEGSLAGLDPTPIGELCAAVATPVLVSGGISGPEDVRTAYELGAAGVVIGTALYAGTVRIPDVRGLRHDT